MPSFKHSTSPSTTAPPPTRSSPQAKASETKSCQATSRNNIPQRVNSIGSNCKGSPLRISRGTKLTHEPPKSPTAGSNTSAKTPLQSGSPEILTRFNITKGLKMSASNTTSSSPTAQSKSLSAPTLTALKPSKHKVNNVNDQAAVESPVEGMGHTANLVHVEYSDEHTIVEGNTMAKGGEHDDTVLTTGISSSSKAICSDVIRDGLEVPQDGDVTKCKEGDSHNAMVAQDVDEDQKDDDDENIEGDHDDDNNGTNTSEPEDVRAGREQIHQISDEKLRRLLLEELTKDSPKKGSIGLEYTHVFFRKDGTYNHTICMGFLDSGVLKFYRLRIPAHGTASLWREEDVYMMDRQVELMKQLRTNTQNVPIPEVYSHSSSLDNALGAPYILMEDLDGEGANGIWFDKLYEEPPWLSADCPSPETHRKRVTFLKSLAGMMTRLQVLKFNCIGVPHIPRPYDLNYPSPNGSDEPEIVGHSYHRPSRADMKHVVKRGPFASTQEYIKEPLDKYFSYPKEAKNEIAEHDDEIDLQTGVRKILDIVFATPAFNPEGKPEKFTICHSDLDLQNILTDEEGNVTGIIDWDGAFAAPRCIGPTAVPMFLQRDWFPDRFGESIYDRPFMAWNAEYYRSIYAAAMVRAHEELYPDIKPEDSDVCFTLKSPIYQAAFAFLLEGDSPYDFCHRILREIPGFRTNPQEFISNLGDGWPAAEKMLRREIPRVLAPVLPMEAAFRELEVNLPSDDKAAENASASLDK